jgi:Domain of unknown function (DUF4279)
MRLRRRAIFVLRTALSYMMTAWSRMSTATLSGISMTSSEEPTRAFATLRFTGDTLDPDEISRIVKEEPTRAYRKGQQYRPGPRSPEVTGKTGVWYFSTRRRIPGNDLVDHLDALVRLILPFAAADKRLRELREIMEREHLEARVTCFWRGPPGAPKPSIPLSVTNWLERLPADIEADFANE